MTAMEWDIKLDEKIYCQCGAIFYKITDPSMGSDLNTLRLLHDGLIKPKGLEYFFGIKKQAMLIALQDEHDWVYGREFMLKYFYDSGIVNTIRRMELDGWIKVQSKRIEKFLTPSQKPKHKKFLEGLHIKSAHLIIPFVIRQDRFIEIPMRAITNPWQYIPFYARDKQ